MESDRIEKILVVGELQKYVGVLVVSAFQVIRKWYEEQEKAYPGNQAVLQDLEARLKIDEAIKYYNQHFNR